MGAAVISGCGRYRYTLEREWLTGAGICLFVMLNPSTADAEQDDPTIRRCIGFAQQWGYRQLAVGNLFAYRTTDPLGLRDVSLDKAIGPKNDDYLRDLSHGAGLIVVAWGAHPITAERSNAVMEILGEAQADVVCLGITKHVHRPRHPLFVSGDTKPEPFPALEAPGAS